MQRPSCPRDRCADRSSREHKDRDLLTASQHSRSCIDPYHLLCLRRDATDKEVTSAYRRLAILSHPVRVNGDYLLFQAASAAFETLRDKRARKRIDAILRKRMVTKHTIGSQSWDCETQSRCSDTSASVASIYNPLPGGVPSEANLEHMRYLNNTDEVFEHRWRKGKLKGVPQRVSVCKKDESGMAHAEYIEHEDPLYSMRKARQFKPFENPYEVFATSFGSSIGVPSEPTRTVDGLTSLEKLVASEVETEERTAETWLSCCSYFPLECSFFPQ